jgi:hypothetical protein
LTACHLLSLLFLLHNKYKENQEERQKSDDSVILMPALSSVVERKCRKIMLTKPKRQKRAGWKVFSQTESTASQTTQFCVHAMMDDMWAGRANLCLLVIQL